MCVFKLLLREVREGDDGESFAVVMMMRSSGE